MSPTATLKKAAFLKKLAVQTNSYSTKDPALKLFLCPFLCCTMEKKKRDTCPENSGLVENLTSFEEQEPRMNIHNKFYFLSILIYMHVHACVYLYARACRGPQRSGEGV